MTRLAAKESAVLLSNLGQMLNKICIADGVPLVNIVRKPEQEQILRELGAKHVVNSSSDTFMDDLIKAMEADDETRPGAKPAPRKKLKKAKAVSASDEKGAQKKKVKKPAKKAAKKDK